MRIRLKRLNAQGVAHHALVAILVISAFASFGAYRVFSSSAATNQKSNNQQTTKQKESQTQKEQKNAKEAELAKQKDTNNNQNTKNNGGNQTANNGGQSQADKDRQAKEKADNERAAKEQAAKEAEQKKKAAEEADRRKKAEDEANRKKVEAEQKKKEEEQRKKDQQAGCTSNQTQVNGKCVERKTCKSDERLTNQNTCEKRQTTENAGQPGSGTIKNTNTTPTTGGPKCAAGFEPSKDGKSCVCPAGQENLGGKCATPSGTPEQIKAQCRAANKGYDVSKNACTTECNKGYELKGSSCVVKLTEDQVRASCAAQYLKYDAKSNTCKNECKPGFIKDDIGVNCLEEKSPQEVKAACDSLFLKYNASSNTCGECKVNFSKSGNICQPNENMNVVKATCAADGKQYDKETNTCKEACKEGYATAVIDNFAEGTSKVRCTPRPSSTDEQNRATCAASFKKWDASTKSCTETCKTGFTQQADGSCVVDQQYGQLKGECDKKFLAFDTETRTCKVDKCKLGYMLNEDKQCVKNEEYEGRMSAQRCAALGRTWSFADTADDSTGFCSDTCVEPTGEYSAQGSPDTSYCVGKNPALSVNEDMSAAECNAANRVFIYLSQVCAPKCKTGYTSAIALLGPGRAMDNTSSTSSDPLACIEGTPADNGGETVEEGGCTDGAEVDEASGLCPGDTEVGQDEPAVTTLDSNISKDLCKQLGREWESGSKDANGEKIKGCKVDECKNEASELIVNESGVGFCEGYVLKISKERCNEAGRVWIKEARGCAAHPKYEGLEDGKRKGGNDVCANEKDVLLAVDGTDVCVSPSRVDRLRDVARSAGLPFAQVVNLSKAGLCKINPNKHWNGEKCVADKPAKDLSTGTPNSNGEPASNGSSSSGSNEGSKAPNGQEWTAFCATLGRSSTGSGCAQVCKEDSKIRNPDSSSYGYDRCTPRSDVCKIDGGTKDCSKPTGSSAGQQGCTDVASGSCRAEAKRDICDRLGSVASGGICSGVGQKACQGNGLRWVVQARTNFDSPFGPPPGKCYWA